MADSNVMSLFGITPEAYQQKQNENLQAEALRFAQLDPFQQASAGAYMAGSRLGTGIGGLLGAEDPQLKAIRAQQSMLQGVDISDPSALRAAASKAMQSGQYSVASQLASKALDIEKEQSIIAKNMRENKAADPFQELLKTAKYTPESLAKYKESGDVKDLTPVDKAGTSEFERLVDGLNISPEAKAAMKEKRVNALISGDTNGLKALQAEIAQARLDDIRSKTQDRIDKAAGEKTQAISRLASTESDIESALGTAEAALKLAPNTFLEAGQQAITSSIPWSDAKSLKNLVGSLNSAKAIQTLEQLKSQSRTGATGFGALSEKELDLILNKTRTLDPTDRMFKENVQEVLSGWQKIRQQLRESRFGLQGNQPAVQAEQSITATMNYNKGMTRSQAINFLKQQGKLPSNF